MLEYLKPLKTSKILLQRVDLIWSSARTDVEVAGCMAALQHVDVSIYQMDTCCDTSTLATSRTLCTSTRTRHLDLLGLGIPVTDAWSIIEAHALTLDRLELAISAVLTIPTLERICLPHLSHLRIECDHDKRYTDGCAKNALTLLLSLDVPRLRDLDVELVCGAEKHRHLIESYLSSAPKLEIFRMSRAQSQLTNEDCAYVNGSCTIVTRPTRKGRLTWPGHGRNIYEAIQRMALYAYRSLASLVTSSATMYSPITIFCR